MSRQNFENYLRQLTRQLEEVPQYIFVTPLVNFAIVDVSTSDLKKPPPNALLGPYRNKARKSEEYQK